jgi:photosystem II stability/assembly factor-like uncharacterized protein
MKKHLLLLALVLGSIGAMAQAFGWTELGTGSNALKANGSILSLCTDVAGEVYAATAINSDSNYYVAKWNGSKWGNLGNSNFGFNTWGLPESNFMCTNGFNISTIYLHPEKIQGSNLWVVAILGMVAEFSFASWDTLPSWDNHSPVHNGYWYLIFSAPGIFSICSDAFGNVYAGGVLQVEDTTVPLTHYGCILEWKKSTSAWSLLIIEKYLVDYYNIFAMCTGVSNTVYIAGTYSNDFGKQVYKFNGAEWNEVGSYSSGVNGNDTIFSLCTDALGNIYAAGKFTNASGKNYVAKWDGTEWSELGGTNALNANGTINSICADAFGNVYAAGNFINDSGYYYVAKWDGMSWSELGSGNNYLNANGNIQKIFTDATGNVYATGNFTDSAGYYYVAKYAKIEHVRWIRQNSNTSTNLNSIDFPSSNTGYAAGAWGTILKTINGGSNWASLNSGTLNSLHSIYFPSTNEGFAVGTAGTIINTTNGGKNWASLSSGTNNQLNSVYFTDTVTGYAVGASGTILKTTNSGMNWISLNSGSQDSLYSVYFIDASTGYVVGASGTILKTNDSGVTWLSKASGTINSLHSIKFINDTTGFAVGDSGTILKTSDGGSTWIAHNVPVSLFLSSVYFTNADTGYATGANGIILKTTIGDTIWAVQNSGTSYNLSSVCFTNQNVGYAVGDSGTIIAVNVTPVTGGINNQSIKSGNLKIYPNPTSDRIIVETTEMPAAGFLSVLNMNGVELIRQQVSAPKIVADVSCLPSGVYVLKFQNQTSVQIGKFIKN